MGSGTDYTPHRVVAGRSGRLDVRGAGDGAGDGPVNTVKKHSSWTWTRLTPPEEPDRPVYCFSGPLQVGLGRQECGGGMGKHGRLEFLLLFFHFLPFSFSFLSHICLIVLFSANCRDILCFRSGHRLKDY